MLMLKMLGVFAAISATIAGLYLFNEHSFRRFQYRFFSWKAFFATGAALVLLMGGFWWKTNAAQTRGDELNGLLLMASAAAIMVVLWFFNFSRTNLLYGVGGSVLQLFVLAQLAYAGIFAAIVIVPLLIAVAAVVIRPVYVINRKKL